MRKSCESCMSGQADKNRTIIEYKNSNDNRCLTNISINAFFVIGVWMSVLSQKDSFSIDELNKQQKRVKSSFYN